jgi:hypothetical protein
MLQGMKVSIERGMVWASPVQEREIIHEIIGKR